MPTPATPTTRDTPALDRPRERARLRRARRSSALAVIIATLSGVAAIAFGLVMWLGVSWRFHALALACFTAIGASVLAGLPHHPHRCFGLANTLTTVRAGLTALAGALVVELPVYGAPATLVWIAAAIAATALALDALDGYVARRTRRVSALGARFDMETDALLILVLSALIAVTGKTGAWVLAIGLMRYVFLLAGYVCPALRRPMAPSLRRKTVCALQGVVLCGMLTPLVPGVWASVLSASLLALLAYSFGVDAVSLLAGSAGPEPDDVSAHSVRRRAGARFSGS